MMFDRFRKQVDELEERWRRVRQMAPPSDQPMLCAGQLLSDAAHELADADAWLVERLRRYEQAAVEEAA
jgi:hypothetical protein